METVCKREICQKNGMENPWLASGSITFSYFPEGERQPMTQSCVISWLHAHRAAIVSLLIPVDCQTAAASKPIWYYTKTTICIHALSFPQTHTGPQRASLGGQSLRCTWLSIFFHLCDKKKDRFYKWIPVTTGFDMTRAADSQMHSNMLTKRCNVCAIYLHGRACGCLRFDV